MKITYRIYNDWSISQVYTLKQFGINVEPGYNRIDIVDSKENQEVLSLLDEWGLKKFYWTDYSKQDYNKSSHFVYAGSWTNGYPMPDNDGGYLALTYDLSLYCFSCGVGKVQKDSFRIRAEPKWGTKGIFELNWVHDEIFVRTEIYHRIFQPLGLQFRPVILFKKEKALDTVVQLVIPDVGSTKQQLSEQEFEICSVCQIKKYSTQTKGFFPGFNSKIPNLPIFKGQEEFGSGAEAHKKIFITKELWDQLKAANVHPNVWPVEPSNK